MRGKDEFVHTQEFIIQDINHTAKAYFQFIEGSLSVRVVGDCNDIQFDFDVYPETLKVFTHLYNEHVKECNSVANQKKQPI